MLLPPWIILAIIGGLMSNGFHFINRFVLKDKDDPIVYAWFYETLKLVIFGIIAIFNWKLIITPQSLLLFMLLGITEAIGAVLLMKMHSYAHLSISTIIYRTRLIWVAVLAFFLFGEILKPFEYLGIIITFVGLSVVVAPKKLFVDKGSIYANLTAFIVALNLMLLKMALPYGSASVLNAVMLLPIVFLFPIFFKNVRTKMNIFKQENIGLKIVATAFTIVSLYTFTIALSLGESSKVNAIYQSMMIFSVLGGIIFLKEREHIKMKLLGTACTLVGIFLLTML